MKRGQFIRWRNYQKTLLAVYRLTEPDGFRCYGTFAELAAESDLSTGTVRRHVRCLEIKGVALRAQNPDRPPRCALVLLDHPGSRGYLKRNMDWFGPLADQVELNRQRRRERQPVEPAASGIRRDYARLMRAIEAGN